MKLICFVLLILLAAPLQANANDVAAIKAAENRNFNKPASTELGKSLVDWYRLQLDDNISFREAATFIRKHPTWPDLNDIQKQAEDNLSASIPSAEIIRFFNDYPPITSRGMIHYLGALIATGQTSQALSTLKNWWPKASIAPNDQKEILDKYGQYLGSQDHERRIRHIIHDKHYTASRDLARVLGRGYPELVEAKIGLIENKGNVNALIAKVPANLLKNEALQLARIQWRRKNDNDAGAIEMLRQAPAHNRLSNPAGWWRERHIMARRLIEQNKWGSAYQLVRDHRQKDGFPFAQAEFLAGWIALRKIGKPWEAFEHFERLFNNVESPISRSRGAYWAGLASESLGHSEIATQWFQVAARYQTTYYGQMAAGRINLPLGLVDPTPIQVTSAARQAFKSQELISAALLLHRAGQRNNAKKFFYAFADKASSGLDFSLIKELSASLGMNDVAIKIAKQAERKGYISPQYLFPVLKEAKQDGYALHPAFIHGIIRQESAFDQYAQSHAGALGLMQLMPATAKETAGKIGLPYSRDRLTNDPTYNMKLGSAYLKQMLDRWDGNRTLAIASYNAGPGRVGRWITEFGDPRDPNIDEVDWIETIPVYETRNYVQRVTEALNVYARLIQ
jgi:soluble lytic murein transglycosylase